jgi:hypothetical protein
MSEYTCPDCGGGFPATAANDDACPWCGEAMNGKSERRQLIPETIPTPQPRPGIGDDDDDDGIGLGPHFQPITPFTPHDDPGIRVRRVSGSTTVRGQDGAGGER